MTHNFSSSAECALFSGQLHFKVCASFYLNSKSVNALCLNPLLSVLYTVSCQAVLIIAQENNHFCWLLFIRNHKAASHQHFEGPVAGCYVS